MGERRKRADSFFLIALADYFKVSIDYLLCREDEFGNIIIK